MQIGSIINVSDISNITTLRPSNVIATDTPSGVGAGELRTTCVLP